MDFENQALLKNCDLPLHLELTSRCMLACPSCPRTIFKGQFEITDLPLSVIHSLLKDAVTPSFVLICGDHGDPIYHPQFHEIIRLLSELKGQPPINIATNGSYHDEVWWRKTAEILRPIDRVTFGIDGLENTSKLYRRNSDWHSATQAMQILKNFGQCKVTWQWILFRFNEHQLREAHRLCKDWRIDDFHIVKSFRDPENDASQPTLTLEQAHEQFLS